MLTRKLSKAQFYGQGLLILAVPQLGSQPTDPSNSSVMSSPVVKVHNKTKFSSRDTADFPSLTMESSVSSNLRMAILAAPEITLNTQAKKFAVVYLKKNNEALSKIKKRSPKYFKVIETILLKKGLPTELKYLAVVESQLQPNAVSRVGAVGPWQLMPQTARGLGLKVNRKNDERKNYTKSTHAAAMHLKSLYTQYGDWLLVIAAYNSGAGRVNRAIRKAGSRDFWKLQAYLPPETRGHVKRFISTQYYFEKRVSEITLTKAEKIEYLKAIKDYKESIKDAAEEMKTIVLSTPEKTLIKTGTTEK